MTGARVDDNQGEIVRALRQAGASVQSIAEVGKGVPDLLCGYRFKTYLLEIKGEKGKPTPAEKDWHSRWRGRPVTIVRTADEALIAIGAIQQKNGGP